MYDVGKEDLTVHSLITYFYGTLWMLWVIASITNLFVFVYFNCRKQKYCYTCRSVSFSWTCRMGPSQKPNSLNQSNSSQSTAWRHSTYLRCSGKRLAGPFPSTSGVEPRGAPSKAARPWSMTTWPWPTLTHSWTRALDVYRFHMSHSLGF